MIRNQYSIKMISPCFCSGSDQSAPEIRPASIRGELRWWFRALGGTLKEESILFGSVHDDTNHSSSVTTRVRDYKPIIQSRPIPKPKQNTADGYLWHFIYESQPKGSRQAVLPNSTFTLEVIRKQNIEIDLLGKWNDTLQAFLHFGALGYRSSRGFGAFHSTDAEPVEDIQAMLEKKGFIIRRRSNPESFPDENAVMRDYAKWLRYDFRKKEPATSSSPLGSTESGRQKSAVRFRPILLENGSYSWLAYEAPHNRVLDHKSKRNRPMLSDYDFDRPAPVDA